MKAQTALFWAFVFLFTTQAIAQLAQAGVPSPQSAPSQPSQQPPMTQQSQPQSPSTQRSPSQASAPQQFSSQAPVKAASEAGVATEAMAAAEARAQQSAPQQSAPQQSAPQQSAPQQSAPQQSAPQQSAPQQSAPQQSASQQSAPQQSAPQQSASQQSATQQSASQQSQLPLPPVRSPDAKDFDAAGAAKCNELLPGYLEALARAQEMVHTYTKQMPSLCSKDEFANLKNVEIPSDLIQMIDNTPPTIEALSDDSMLARVGEDRCKLVYLLITSNSRRVETLENIINGMRAQCQASSCAADNARLQSKMAIMEADFKAKLDQAKKENDELTRQKAGLEEQVSQLTGQLNTCKSGAASIKELLGATSSQLNTCMSDASKVRHDLDACNRNHEVTKVGYNECQLHIKRVDGLLEGEKKEITKCVAREQVMQKEKEAVQAQLQSEVAKNVACEDRAKCTADKNEAQLLKADIVKCNGQVTALTGNVQNLETQVGQLSAVKVAQSAQIASLQAVGNTTSAQIASQSKTIGELNQKVESLSRTATSLGKQLKTASQNLAVCSKSLVTCNKKLLQDGASCNKKLSLCHETVKHCDKNKVDLIAMYQKRISDAADTSKKARRAAAAELAACQKDAAVASRDAKARLALARKAIDHAHVKLDKCRSSRDRCRNKVATLKDSNDALTSQISALKSEIKDLGKKPHSTAAQCRQTLEDVRTQLASSQATLKQCTKDHNAAVVEAESLRKIRKLLNAKLSALSNDLQSKTLDLKKSLEQMHSLERQLKIETDKFNQGTVQTQALRREVDRLEKSVSDAAAEEAALQNKYDSLSDKSSKDALALKAKLDAASASLDEESLKMSDAKATLGARIEELKSLDANLKARLTELQNHRDLHSEDIAEKEKLEHSLAILKQIEAQTEKDLQTRTALADELQKKLDALTLSCQSKLSASSSALQQCETKTSSLADELKAAESDHRKNLAKLEDTQTKLRAASLNLAVSAAEISKRKKSEAKVVSQLSACRDNAKVVDVVQSKLTKCSKKKTEFRQMIKDLSSQHSRATNDVIQKLADAQTDNQATNKRLAKCHARLARRAAVIVKSKDQIEALNKELGNSNAQKLSLSAQIVNRVKRIKELKNLVKDKESEVQALKKKMANQHGAYSDATLKMTARIKQLKDEIVKHKTEKKQLESENLSLNNQYKQAVKKIAQLGKRSDEQSATIGKYKSRIDADQTKITGMTTSIGKYKSSIVQYKRQLGTALKSAESVKALKAKLKRHRQDFRIAYDKISKLKQKSGEYSEQLHLANQKIDQYREELRKDRQSTSLISRKFAQTRKLVSYLKGQLDEARSRARDSGNDLVIFRRMKDRIADLSQRLRRANSVKENLRELLREHKVMISRLKKMVDSRPSQREFDQLERAMEASRDNVRELKTKLRDLAGADDQYREELDDDKEKMDQYEQELDNARNSNSLILTKLAQTRRLVNKLMQQRNEALSLVRKYRLSLEQGDTERARDESDIRSIRARVAGLNLKLQRANAVQKNLRGLLREHKVMINGLKKLLRSRPSQDQVDELNRALKASRETIKALKAKLQVFADSDDAPASDEHDDHHRISITVSAPGSRPSELA